VGKLYRGVVTLESAVSRENLSNVRLAYVCAFAHVPKAATWSFVSFEPNASGRRAKARRPLLIE
jgi:hypothetical protein